MASTSSPDGSATPAKPDGAKAVESEKPATAWVVPVVTAVVLALAFCAYYFIYVGARRQYLANRNFRALALLGEQLQQRISIHSNILEFCARLAVKTDGSHRKKEDLERFLLVHSEDQDLPRADKLREALKDYLKYLSPSFELSEVTRRQPTPRSGLQVERRNDHWVLTLNSVLDYEGSLKLDELMQPLVESVPFDDILLVSNQGSVVYQSNKVGPQFTTLSGLLQSQIGTPDKPAKAAAEGEAGGGEADSSKARTAPIRANSDPSWRGRSVHLTDVALAGTPYKLFLQPVLVSAFSGTDNQNEPATEWVLCGLRSSKALDWEALSLSYTFFIWSSFAFFILWANYKVLKIFFMNHRERLRLRELGALGLSLLLLTTVVTLSLLQMDYRMTDDTDSRLQELGGKFSRNVHDELRQMRQQLIAWCGSPELQSDLRAVMRQNKEVIRSAPPDRSPPVSLSGKIDRTPEPLEYPYTANGFWTDDDGHQIVKWSANQYVTPMIDISELSINARPTAHLDGDSRAFQFVSIMPPNKVEYLATFGMKLQTCAGDRLDPTIRQDIAGGGAFLTVQPLSLVDPILPYGFAFALVDEAGSVLFHSDKTRNGRENFRMETDDNRELYAAIFGHSSQRTLQLKYRGTDYRALVVPVQGVSQAPWSLIVYRDLTSVRTLNLQAMAVASTMLFLILVVPVILGSVWLATLRPRFAPEWVWPNRRRIETYLYQIFLYLLLTIACLAVVFYGSSEAILVSSAAAVYTALLLTWWCYLVYPSTGEKPLARKDSRQAALPALLAGLGALLLLAMVLTDWSHLRAASLVLATGIGAIVPLMERPRRTLIEAFHRGKPVEGAAERNRGERGERGFLNYRRCYMGSLLMLLLLAGVVVPMGLFRAGLNVERRLAVKQAQRHLAAGVAGRWASLVAQRDNSELGNTAWDELQDKPGRRSDGHPWRWIVPADLATRDRDFSLAPHSAGFGELYSGWFQRLLYSLHHDYNESSAEMLGVIRDSGSSADWNWDNRPAQVTLRWHGAHPGAAAADPLAAHDDLLIASAIPEFSWRDAATCLAVFFAVAVLIGGLLRALARKIFLFHMAPLKITGTRLVAESLREGKNIVVILPPVSDWQLDGPKWTLDVAAIAGTPRWAELLDLAALPAYGVIEILHFEFSTNDPEIDGQKFVLLERLEPRENTQLAVILRAPVSPADYRREFPRMEVIDLREEPFPWLRQYEGPARDLIWKECCPIPALWPIGAQLAKDLKAENIHSRDTIASEILERADPYYRLVWSECTKEQKFVLAQLAEDGLLNPTNDRTIRQLMRRGLITEDPQFHLVNESLRRFVRSAATIDLKKEWLRESRKSGWGKAHGAFFTSMTLLGLFLLTTQNALWQSAAAYVTTALGALGTMAKVFDAVRARSGGGGEKPS